MLSYLVRALVKMAVTLFLIVTVVFFATRLSGGAIDFISGDALDSQSRQDLIVYYGLNQDIFTQYQLYLRGIAEGEFGLSFIERRPVTVIFGKGIWPTAQLVGCAVLLTIAVAVPAGIYAAIRRERASAGAGMTIAFLGYAIPNFVLATLMLLVFSYWLQILPSAGNGIWAHFVMPVTTLALFYIAGLVRYTRNAMLDVLGQAGLPADGAGQGPAGAPRHPRPRAAQHCDHHALGPRPDGDGARLVGRRRHRERVLLARHRRPAGALGGAPRLPGAPVRRACSRLRRLDPLETTLAPRSTRRVPSLLSLGRRLEAAE